VKILLINDNPVVTKLVTLSAKKVSSELDAVAKSEDIPQGEFDLVVVDDQLFNDELMEQIQTNTSFKKSLLILSKGVQAPGGFDYTITKPFLPTDMVELLASIEKELEAQTDSLDEDEILLDEIQEAEIPEETDAMTQADQEIEEEFSDDMLQTDALEEQEESSGIDDMQTELDDLDMVEEEELQKS